MTANYKAEADLRSENAIRPCKVAQLTLTKDAATTSHSAYTNAQLVDEVFPLGRG